MIDTVKDSITWLFNQEDARAIIRVIHPREFTVVEAIITEDGHTALAAETSKMVQWQQDEAVEKLEEWMNDVNKKWGHEPGKRYIYFRFKRWN